MRIFFCSTINLITIILLFVHNIYKIQLISITKIVSSSSPVVSSEAVTTNKENPAIPVFSGVVMGGGGGVKIRKSPRAPT